MRRCALCWISLSVGEYPDLISKEGLARIFADGVELTDDATGMTAAHLGGGFNEMSMDDTSGKEPFAKESFQIISAGRDHLVGVVPGLRLRLSVSNPVAWDKGQRILRLTR